MIRSFGCNKGRGKPWTERPYPRDQAIALLRAISMAKRWKPDRFLPILGPGYYYNEPSLCVVLVWYRSAGNSEERERKSVQICRGNKIVGYRSTLYQLSKEGREVLDNLLPSNSGTSLKMMRRGPKTRAICKADDKRWFRRREANGLATFQWRAEKVIYKAKRRGKGVGSNPVRHGICAICKMEQFDSEGHCEPNTTKFRGHHT